MFKPLLLAALILAPSLARASALEDAVLTELNLARADPPAYVAKLRAYRALFDGKIVRRPGRNIVVSTEGVAAVDEAIDFLAHQAPLGPLDKSTILAQAAQDHVRDQSASGGVGHIGTDGSRFMQRIDRHGHWLNQAAENISYGAVGAEAVIIQLMVDDGEPERGHRATLFDPAFRVVGVSCGSHPAYRVMCVMEFAVAVRGEGKPSYRVTVPQDLMERLNRPADGSAAGRVGDLVTGPGAPPVVTSPVTSPAVTPPVTGQTGP